MARASYVSRAIAIPGNFRRKQRGRRVISSPLTRGRTWPTISDDWLVLKKIEDRKSHVRLPRSLFRSRDRATIPRVRHGHRVSFSTCCYTVPNPDIIGQGMNPKRRRGLLRVYVSARRNRYAKLILDDVRAHLTAPCNNEQECVWRDTPNATMQLRGNART